MPFSLRPHVIAADTDDVTVLLDSRSGRYWQLNQTGSTALRALLAGSPAEHVAAELAEHFGVPESVAANDVNLLVKDLLEHRLATDE